MHQTQDKILYIRYMMLVMKKLCPQLGRYNTSSQI